MGGFGLLAVLAIAAVVWDRATSRGLARIGTEIPFDVEQVHLHGDLESEHTSESVEAPQVGDRLNLTVDHHAKLISSQREEEVPAVGFIMARKKECLITFPTLPSIQGYRTTTLSAHIAYLYYSLRGGMLLLSQRIQSSPDDSSAFTYLLIDGRWCIWLNVQEGILLVSEPTE